MARVKEYLSIDESGSRVFDCIFDAQRTDRMFARDIANKTGMTPTQVRYGLGYVKDLLANDTAQPLIFDFEIGYRFADSVRAVAEYGFYRAKTWEKQLSRMERGTTAPAAKRFMSNIDKDIAKQIKRLREDMHDLVLELGEMAVTGPAPAT